MVAPLIAAAARTAGTQLARRGAAQAAGAQLAKGGATRAAGGTLAKNAPQVIGKQAPNTIMAPNQMKGPVYGYTEPKVVQSDIDIIKDWQGEIDNKNKAVKAGEILNPQNISGVKKSEINIEEREPTNNFAQNFQIERNEIISNAQNMANYNLPRRFATPRPKLNGPGYFLVLFVAIFKDILDLIFELIGLVLDIFIVTMPLGIFLEIIDWILDFTTLIITQGFFLINGVKMNTKKWTWQGTTTIVESIPFIGVLPLNSISFAYQVSMINKERKQEEEAEQQQLDNEYEEEQAKFRQMIQMQYEQELAQINQIETQIQSTTISTPEVNKPKGNEWKEMVEQSDQNITVMNNQNKTNTTTEVKK